MNPNQSRPGTFQQADHLMHQGLAEGVFPGAVLLVADRDAVVFHRAYGFAEPDSRRIMTLDTVFDLASLTKPPMRLKKMPAPTQKAARALLPCDGLVSGFLVTGWESFCPAGAFFQQFREETSLLIQPPHLLGKALHLALQIAQPFHEEIVRLSERSSLEP